MIETDIVIFIKEGIHQTLKNALEQRREQGTGKLLISHWLHMVKTCFFADQVRIFINKIFLPNTPQAIF